MVAGGVETSCVGNSADLLPLRVYVTGMSRYIDLITRRFTAAVVTLLLVSLIVFGLMEMVPGNCAERMIAYKDTQGISYSEADVRAEEARMGLDRPFMERWGRWVAGIVLRFDLGTSCLWRMEIGQLIGDKMTLSLGLAFGALIVTYAIAVPAGILSAVLSDSWFDGSMRFISYLVLALPNFLLALVIMLFSTMFF